MTLWYTILLNVQTSIYHCHCRNVLFTGSLTMHSTPVPVITQILSSYQKIHNTKNWHKKVFIKANKATANWLPNVRSNKETDLKAHVQLMHDKDQLVSTLWEHTREPTNNLIATFNDASIPKQKQLVLDLMYTLLDESEFLINTLYAALTFRH